MNESVGYTVTINIIITFIIIVFVILSNILIYYKSNKSGNIIVESIERYGGYNELSRKEINEKLAVVGYNINNINCTDKVASNKNTGKMCSLENKNTKNVDGYCIYYCNEGDYYYYKVKANMIMNIPIINEILAGSVFSSTANIYDFKGVIMGDVDENGVLNINDVSLIQKYSAGLGNLNTRQKWLADINGDGEVTTKDATIIQEKIAGI